MNLSLFARPAALAALVGLSACGGGSSEGPAVATLQASPAMFGRTTTVTVQGSNLDSSVTASIEPGCTQMTRLAGGNANSQSFSCRISWLGDLRVRIRKEGGAELASLRLDIPLPQVAFNVASGSATGRFVVELDPEKVPGTVDNFLGYVNQSTCFYRNTLFHRVIPNFVVQAGGYTANLTTKNEGKGPPVALETNRGLSNLRGTIAMARTDDPNSATSEFYVNVKDNPELDYASAAKPGYAVFGKVVSGLEDIDRIANAPTTSKGLFPNAPVTEITITGCGQTK
ncbi:peptidylprolyl isomerase [Aquincola sp. S2]|uniref:Peptidyl-prolyl cis-trans isomerase n=1 Tax=Pseudaquabacterium terrae TaxID=2732868 RepID=A0ABX2EDX0_9BURK|nr:peptidylprolyl isomerase [Aquabacterium terrae]NRF66810.1 peptidylprolyl isomerase [Aquabacterium terrae]